MQMRRTESSVTLVGVSGLVTFLVCSQTCHLCNRGRELPPCLGPQRPEEAEVWDESCGQWSRVWHRPVAPETLLEEPLNEFCKWASKVNRLQTSVRPGKTSLVSFTSISARSLPSTLYCLVGTAQARGCKQGAHETLPKVSSKNGQCKCHPLGIVLVHCMLGHLSHPECLPLAPRV